MRELIIKVDEEIYEKLKSFLLSLPPEKINIEEKKENLKKYYGILKIDNIENEIKKIRDEWEERLPF